MDNKKIVSVAVLAVLALAFAGYGYADYTASTYNEGNEVVVNYLTVEPDNWNAIAAASGEDAFEVNTYTYGDEEILYKIVGDDNITETDDDPQYIQIGEDYTLTITDETTEAFDKYKIDISILGQVNNTGGFKLYIKYVDVNGNDAYEELASTTSLTVAAAADNPTDVVLGLYLGFIYDTEIEFPDADEGWIDLVGSSDAPAEEPLLTGPENGDANHPGATFIFKVSGITA